MYLVKWFYLRSLFSLFIRFLCFLANHKKMKLTKKQQEDIDFYLEFCPSNFYHQPTDEEIKEFLDFSERGVKPVGEKGGASGQSLNPIIIGKSYLGLNIQLWQEGVMEGSIGYFSLLGGFDDWEKENDKYIFKHKPVSRRLVDYMKSQMFKGIDAEIIETAYQKILSEKDECFELD